jgi:hypothetical protein
MRIVFSRKGFDSASGGAPSPIVNGRPVSLPIPAGAASRTSYADLGLGALVEDVTRRRIAADTLCHHDPMFVPRCDGESAGEWLFGQVGAAQTHLANRGVTKGDFFVFFGLFREEASGEPHHRIFGWMQVEAIIDLPRCGDATRAQLEALSHPHAIAMHGRNDCIWRGRGGIALTDDPRLRLTVPGGPPSLWAIPSWLRDTGLSYHDRPDRWMRGLCLRSVARGQEFVAHCGRKSAPRLWLDDLCAVIAGRG